MRVRVCTRKQKVLSDGVDCAKTGKDSLRKR